MEHDFIESDVFDTPIHLMQKQSEIIEEKIGNEIKRYIQYEFGLVFNKQEMIKVFQLYNNRLTSHELQYLINALEKAEANWGVKTDLQEKLLRLMEIMGND